jgi:hypothetical protein
MPACYVSPYGRQNHVNGILICRQARVEQLHCDDKPPQRQGMTTFIQLTSASFYPPEPFTSQLRLAVAAYLAASRAPPASTPNRTCAVSCPGVPSAAWTRWPPGGPHLELYIQWMQEVRRFKPSTVSRRFSVAAGFYRTGVLNGNLEHPPAEHADTEEAADR